MSTYNIHFQDKMIALKLSQHFYYISSHGKSFKGLKTEFEIAVVNEPPVFERLKVYCIFRGRMRHRVSSNIFINRTSNDNQLKL